MRILTVAVLLSLAMLTACGAEAKPNSYWDNHAEQALARLEECHENADKVDQQIAAALMKSPASEAEMMASLPPDTRECVYLTGEFRADKARRKVAGD